MEEKIAIIKKWLGTGSINIFGLPMSGKDTVGIGLAKAVEGKFLSSGNIIRAMEEKRQDRQTASGKLTPTNLFYEWVLPYFEKRELWHTPLILSSIGRWHGEEPQVLNVAEGAGHPIKAVIYLEISEEEALKRWDTAAKLQDRGERFDDGDLEVFKTRIHEFKDKTLPVIDFYKDQGTLIVIPAEGSREEVFERVIDSLAKFAAENSQLA